MPVPGPVGRIPPTWSKAQSRAVAAFEEVQMVPPCRPVKALIEAEEFM